MDLPSFIRRWKWKRAFRKEFTRILGCSRYEAKGAAILLFNESDDPIISARREAELWENCGYNNQL